MGGQDAALKIKSVSVVGAGAIGSGIAHGCATARFEVVLIGII